jgi:CBS-domain-containing membrane protein
MAYQNSLIQQIRRFVGFGANTTGHLEKWVSGLGGLCGILAVVTISRQFVPEQGAAWVVASMGATAVLLFAVPHGPLSQPWPVLGGHLVSAVIGVACARWIPDHWLAAALAVALAIAVMHYLQCIHPPGGATALTAVVGGAPIHQLGFDYVLTPVFLNALVILGIAILFNYPFAWRRYPAVLAEKPARGGKSAPSPDDLSSEELQKALQLMNSTIDISGDDLASIYRLARQIRAGSGLQVQQLQPGHYYSNGEYGADWQVRQIIDMSGEPAAPDSLLIYKVVAGADRRKTGTISFGEFARWARYEVVLNENSWQLCDASRQEVSYE